MENLPIITFAFWIKAFIPAEVPLVGGKMYTVPVPGQPGKTMISHPLRMEMVVPQHPENQQPYQTTMINDYGYSTNNRGFSNNPKAEAKMTTYIEVSIFNHLPEEPCVSRIGLGCLQNKYFTFGGRSYCDLATEYDFSTGRENWTDRGNTNRMRINPAFCDIQSGGFLRIHFTIDCEASLPRSTVARAFGNVNYSGRITFDEQQREISSDLAIDDFPAFEAYGSLNGNPGKALLQVMPELGSTVIDLGGLAGTDYRVSGRGVKSSISDDADINQDDVIWVDTSQPPPSPKHPPRNKKIIRKRKGQHFRSALRDSNHSGDFENSLSAAAAHNKDYLPFDPQRRLKNSDNTLEPLPVIT